MPRRSGANSRNRVMSTIHAPDLASNSFSQHRNSLRQRAGHMPLAYSVRAAPRLRAGADTDWPAVIDGCRDLLAIVFGTNATMDTFEKACAEAGRKGAARPQDPRLKRLRPRLEDHGSLRRAQRSFI